MKKKIVKLLAVTMASVMLFGGMAFAGINFVDYNLTVGRFNGIGDTEAQKKNTTGTDGYIISICVGGDYVVDARMVSSSGNGNWTRNVTDNQTRMLPGTEKQKKGCSVKARFSNDWNTPVGVNVRGQFMSN